MYLRTKLDLGKDEEIDEFVASLEDNLTGCVDEIGFGPDRVSWENGLVLRFSSPSPPTHIYAPLRPALETFDVEAWTIFQPGRDFLEYPPDGPLSQFLGVIASDPVTQFYLMARDDDLTFKSSAEEIRKTEKAKRYSI
jgi:hypothetical protein